MAYSVSEQCLCVCIKNLVKIFAAKNLSNIQHPTSYKLYNSGSND